MPSSPESKEKPMRCPECVEAGNEDSVVYVDQTLVTLMCTQHYFDENGTEHFHDPNKHGTECHCSYGHTLVKIHYPRCPVDDCSWNDTVKETVVHPQKFY